MPETTKTPKTCACGSRTRNESGRCSLCTIKEDYRYCSTGCGKALRGKHTECPKCRTKARGGQKRRTPATFAPRPSHTVLSGLASVPTADLLAELGRRAQRADAIILALESAR